jgi:Ethanolamine utilization protein EutJ (predicted chaperonin)
MYEIIKELKALEPRIRQMEMDVNNNKLISRALVWIGTTAGSAAVIMFITYLANLGR